MEFDFEKMIIGINTKVNTNNKGKVRNINFDNAATTAPFNRVIEVIGFLSNYYGSIGRGAGQKAEITSRIYNYIREYIMDYFNIASRDEYTVIYVNNTTDGINKLARSLIKDKNEVVISTRMEHHSNDLPWRRVCKVDYIDIDKDGRLRVDTLEQKLKDYKGKVRYVTVTGASNVTGYINDIHKIARISHKYNAEIIVDGAQLVPHERIDMCRQNREEDIDFLVFSAHKIYAPFGGGVIIGRREDLRDSPPFNEGGGTVNLVLDNKVIYSDVPEKEEAGTPNYFGAVAMAIALEEMEKIGFNYIKKKDNELKELLVEGLKSIPRIEMYGDIENYKDTTGIVVFNINNMFHEDVAEILAKDYGIFVRSGWFCAHPYCRRLMGLDEKASSAFLKESNERMQGMIRVSFGIYNNREEVEYFLETIEDICRENK